MVTDRYQHIVHVPTIDELVAWALAEDLAAHRHRQPARRGAARGGRAAPSAACCCSARRDPGLSDAARAAATASVDHPVRLDPIDQRRRRLRHRDAHLAPPARPRGLTRGRTAHVRPDHPVRTVRWCRPPSAAAVSSSRSPRCSWLSAWSPPPSPTAPSHGPTSAPRVTSGCPVTGSWGTSWHRAIPTPSTTPPTRTARACRRAARPPRSRARRRPLPRPMAPRRRTHRPRPRPVRWRAASRGSSPMPSWASTAGGSGPWRRTAPIDVPSSRIAARAERWGAGWTSRRTGPASPSTAAWPSPRPRARGPASRCRTSPRARPPCCSSTG